ncbi:carbohydrate esterase family 8 protein [Boletus coccyginus]|nr:carbohydrate esterase family 8 protein [Boletus coccyginus]
MRRLSLATIFCLFDPFWLVLGLSPTYLQCQLQKPAGESPLEGCPGGTLFVSPTDPAAAFTSVQEAIDSLPETGNAVILIGEGQYFGVRLNVTCSAPVTLLGQLDPDTAFIRDGNATQRNLVHIWNNLYAGTTGLTDDETATLILSPSLGHHFGNVDFRAYNIDFENRAANYAIAQALVTSITSSNASFYGCTFASWQDTWYTGHGANTYVVDSIIYGQTDYLFGSGIAWFQSVTLANRACGGGITAWKGEPGTRQGVYIANSRIIRSPDADAAKVTTGNCYLGRPWNDYAVAVFLRTYMDESIRPVGFKPWSGDEVPNTTFYAEFDSYGPGGNTSVRVPQDHILSAEQAKKYRLKQVFHEAPGWIDFGYHHWH